MASRERGGRSVVEVSCEGATDKARVPAVFKSAGGLMVLIFSGYSGTD